MTTMTEASIIQRATTHPDDVQAQIQAAYHCDAHRTEAEAVVHYDAAWKLGVPLGARRGFMLGYGSTLKNVGRLDESEDILRQAIDEYPGDPSLRVFLALTLHAHGKASLALAEMVDVVLGFGDDVPEVAAYSKALSFYANELRR